MRFFRASFPAGQDTLAMLQGLLRLPEPAGSEVGVGAGVGSF